MFIRPVVSQKATDHHQFPEMMNKTLKNLKFLPEHICADASYHTRRTLEYINETGLNVLIDNNRSAKLKMDILMIINSIKTIWITI